MVMPLLLLYGFLLNTYTSCMLAFLPPAVKSLVPVLTVARDAFEGEDYFLITVRVSGWAVEILSGTCLCLNHLNVSDVRIYVVVPGLVTLQCFGQVETVVKRSARATRCLFAFRVAFLAMQVSAPPGTQFTDCREVSSLTLYFPSRYLILTYVLRPPPLGRLGYSSAATWSSTRYCSQYPLWS